MYFSLDDTLIMRHSGMNSFGMQNMVSISMIALLFQVHLEAASELLMRQIGLDLGAM